MRVAGPLDAAQQERLAGALSTRYGADVTVNVVVDPEVLGGMRVEIGDDVIDAPSPLESTTCASASLA
ncbi:hypothetical protein GCM10023065_31150 [Microbacterium laevaniformans]|uniref:F0F1 ATP synthase subunit delta n=1 Tax=Microbacterium laevaniformans TaxID=36807 RepID=UPI003370D1C0